MVGTLAEVEERWTQSLEESVKGRKYKREDGFKIRNGA